MNIPPNMMVQYGGSEYIQHTPHNEYPPSIRVLCSAVPYSGAQKECSPNILVLYGGELLCSGAPHILVLYWGSYEGVAKANTRGGGFRMIPLLAGTKGPAKEHAV